MNASSGPINRVPPGVPTGGQFAQKTSGEADLTLDDPAGDWRMPGVLAERRKLLADAGYVPAAALPASIDPTSTANRREWWDQSFALGEYGDARGDYAQMPDDFTPSMTTGRSLEGNRRTHRMCYRGAGVALRMPSATSIKRYASQSPSATFDVPVSATHPGGTVTGWVRVTRGDDGTWATRGLGFSPADSAYVAEAAQAVLQARRPSRALAEVGDLLDRRRQRATVMGTRMEVAHSTWIARLGYDKGSSTMMLGTSGTATSAPHRYGFKVPAEVYQAVARSGAPGRVFNQVIKGRATRVEVDECPSCHRFSTAGAGHRCPPRESRRNPLGVGVNRLHRHAAAGPGR